MTKLLKNGQYQYQQKDFIGESAFAKVYKGIVTKTQKVIAVRILPLNLIKKYGAKIKEIINGQVNMLRELAFSTDPDRMFTTKIYDCFLTDNNVTIILEFCPDGNLDQIINKKGALSESQALEIVYQLARGIEFISKNNVVHRDIKPDNIFLKKEGQSMVYKLGDFGFAVKKQINEEMVGTPIFMSPEIFREESYGSEVDVWAFGLLVHYMLFKEYYFIAVSESQIKKRVLNEEYKLKNHHLQLISSEMADFLTKCLKFNKKDRIKATQISQHPAFNKVRPKVEILMESVLKTSDIMESLEKYRCPKDRMNNYIKPSNFISNFASKLAAMNPYNLITMYRHNHNNNAGYENPKLQKAKFQLKKILENEPQHDFNKVYQQIQQFTTEQEMLTFLSEFTKKKTAAELAKDFFIAFQKDKISLPKIEQFYQKLMNLHMVGEDIDQIRRFLRIGRKNKIKKFLDHKLGEIESNKLFTQYQNQFVQKEAQPMGGAIYLKDLEGLKILKYPQIQFSNLDRYKLKTLIVLGETGCGKSTFLNSLVNFLAGVEVEDPFRYFIVIQNTQTQLKSITTEISEYYIQDIRNSNWYRVFDTPGFGDTSGISKDQDTIKKIGNLFKNHIDQLHLVLFLIKSSDTRVTPYHKYIFTNIMDLFDKSIAENFVFVLTFSDAAKSAVLQHLKSKQKGFGDYWDIIQQPKTIQINNSGFFQKIDSQNKITSEFWQIGTKCMQDLITKAEKISPKSLNLTKQLIRKKQKLSLRIKNTAKQFQINIVNQDNIRQQLLQILDKEDQMEKNEDFQVEVDQQQWYGETVSINVTRCNNCMNTNCHQSCGYGNGESKRDCCAMDSNGNCTICPGKCSYIAHTNDHILRKVRTVKKKTTLEDLKKKYYDAKSKVSNYEIVVEGMIKQYEQSQKDTRQSIKVMIELQKQLINLSMSKDKPKSTRQYIEFLIANQMRQRKPGYLKKIQTLNRVIQQLQIEEKTINGEILNQMQIRKKSLFEDLKNDPRTQSSSTFKKFIGFFKKIF